MAVNDVDFLSDPNVAQEWETTIDSRECCFSMNHHRRYIIYFEPVGQIAYACTIAIGMCYYHHLDGGRDID